MTPTHALRLHLWRSLGLGPVVLAACAPAVEEVKDTGETDLDVARDTADTSGTADTGKGDSGVITPGDSGDSGDSDSSDSGAGDSGPGDSGTQGDSGAGDSGPGDSGDSGSLGDSGDSGTQGDSGDSGDSGAPGCPYDATAEAQWNKVGYFQWSERYQVCLGVPYADAACQTAGYTEVDAAFEAIKGPDCSTTGGMPPCDDGFTFVGQVVCGPDDTITADCCFTIEVGQIAIGRPLLVAGEGRQAPVVAVAGWADTSCAPTDEVDPERLAAAWLEVARAEHASVGSFARFVLDLLALGAPSDLVAGASRALADEVRHAQAAFGLASTLGGEPVGPGALDVGGVEGRTDVAVILRDLVVEGCVGETLAAHEAAVAASVCRDPAIRAVLEGIARDEAEHAALAWRSARWILATHPDLRADAEDALLRACTAFSRLPGLGEGLEAGGILGTASRQAAARRAVHDIVLPTWAAMGR